MSMIRQIRIQSGMTQAAISEMLGIPLRTWQRYEQRGTAKPSVLELLRIKLAHRGIYILSDGSVKQ